MGRFYGGVGYAEQVEKARGVWEEVVTERNYAVDILKNTKRNQSGESLNDDLVISNEFSIVADPYALQNFHCLRYVRWMGACWKITRVDVQSPRLILSVGGVYNGNTTGTTEQV